MYAQTTHLGQTAEDADEKAGGTSPEKYQEVEIYVPGKPDPVVVRRDPGRGHIIVNPHRHPDSEALIRDHSKEHILEMKKAGQVQTSLRAAKGGAPTLEWDTVRFSMDRVDSDRMTPEMLDRMRELIVAALRADPLGGPGQRMVLAWPWHTDTGNTHLDVQIHRLPVDFANGYAAESMRDLGKIQARVCEMVNATLVSEGFPPIEDWKGPGGNSIFAPAGQRGEPTRRVDEAVAAAGGRPVAGAPVPNVGGAPHEPVQQRRGLDPEEERVLRARRQMAERLSKVQESRSRLEEEEDVLTTYLADLDHAAEALTQAREARAAAAKAEEAKEQAEEAKAQAEGLRDSAVANAVKAKAEANVQQTARTEAEEKLKAAQAEAKATADALQRMGEEANRWKREAKGALEFVQVLAEAEPEDREHLDVPDNATAKAVAEIVATMSTEARTALETAQREAEQDKTKAVNEALEAARKAFDQEKTDAVKAAVDQAKHQAELDRKAAADAAAAEERARLLPEIDRLKQDVARANAEAEAARSLMAGLQQQMQVLTELVGTMRQQPVQQAPAAPAGKRTQAPKTVPEGAAPVAAFGFSEGTTPRLSQRKMAEHWTALGFGDRIKPEDGPPKHISVTLPDGTVVRDRGRSLEMSNLTAPENAAAMLAQIAANRGWTAVTLTGDTPTKDRLWLECSKLGIASDHEPGAKVRREFERWAKATGHGPSIAAAPAPDETKPEEPSPDDGDGNDVKPQ